ncbi:18704_t:CDS:2 [Dentiscutata erythropus]|uniref:18704_t:CDS:1 n=1 Tax=Dentiscutata erythropus TaxID=1348616 RepID=A0A9N8VWE9_9GLOM|nr:18704_t:CDS:2 [Dentiscutata erythropus]
MTCQAIKHVTCQAIEHVTFKRLKHVIFQWLTVFLIIIIFLNIYLSESTSFDDEKKAKRSDDKAKRTVTKSPKICIVGAGLSGLFSALLLKEAGIKDVTILESSDRVGGRVYTKYFTADANDDKRLYAELGATRFPIVEGHPELSQHQLVYDTITYLNEYNKVNNPDSVMNLTSFKTFDKNALYYFNGKKDANGSIITKGIAFGGAKTTALGYPDSIPDGFLDMWDDALAPFFDLLDKNFTNGIETLKLYDSFSAYDYLKDIYFPTKLPQSMAPYEEVMKAIEMNVLGTGIFSSYGFVDLTLNEYEFGSPSLNITQKTIDKGMQRFPNAFLPLIQKENYTLNYNSEVTKLEMGENQTVKVYWKNGDTTSSEVFDRVIVTAPLGNVYHWELPQAFTYYKKRALRELTCMNAARVYLQFKSRFWEESPLVTGAPKTSTNLGIFGGATSTDLPIRFIVYPSQYAGTPTNSSAILLASYVWDSSATKFSPYTTDELYDAVLKNLVTLHGDIAKTEWVSGSDNNIAFNWAQYKHSIGGAFEMFSAGQTDDLLGAMMRPEISVHWAGEHTDIQTGWMVGALSSGARVVKEILLANGMDSQWATLKNSTLLKYWNAQLDFKGYF